MQKAKCTMIIRFHAVHWLLNNLPKILHSAPKTSGHGPVIILISLYIVCKFTNLRRLKVSFYSEYDSADRSWENYSDQSYLLKFQLWQSPFLVAQIFVMRSYMFPDAISWSDFTKYLQCKIATAWKSDCVLAWQRVVCSRDCMLARRCVVC